MYSTIFLIYTNCSWRTTTSHIYLPEYWTAFIRYSNSVSLEIHGTATAGQLTLQCGCRKSILPTQTQRGYPPVVRRVFGNSVAVQFAEDHRLSEENFSFSSRFTNFVKVNGHP